MQIWIGKQQKSWNRGPARAGVEAPAVGEGRRWAAKPGLGFVGTGLGLFGTGFGDFKLRLEKVLCRVCFEAEIGVVLLPCRHRILCSMHCHLLWCSACCDKCKKCPICRVLIEERLPVYDV
ncbi:hypothetical protein C3L33_00968, partial [Rhododendron williamsianum]